MMTTDEAQRLHVALFAHMVQRPEHELDLARAALFIAEPEYPDLQIEHYIDQLDELAELLRPAIRHLDDGTDRALALAREFSVEQRFAGNFDAYHDPRNSFLNEVLDRRVGIPISLAVILLELAARLDVPLHGVSFPGHFLVRTCGRVGLLVDPLSGQPMTSTKLRELLAKATGQRRDPMPDEVEPTTKHAILGRMLNNLRAVYAKQGDRPRQRLAEDRIKAIELAMRTLAGWPAEVARADRLH